MQKIALALALVASLGTAVAAPATAAPSSSPTGFEVVPSPKGQESSDWVLCQLFRACR